MSHKDRFQAKDKMINKMTRDGLVEVNAATGEASRISKHESDFSLKKGNASRQEALTKEPGKPGTAHRHSSAPQKGTEQLRPAEPASSSTHLADTGKQPEIVQTKAAFPSVHGVSDQRMSDKPEEITFQPKNKPTNSFTIHRTMRSDSSRSKQNVPTDKVVPQKETAYYQQFAPNAVRSETTRFPDGQPPAQTDSTGVRNDTPISKVLPQEVLFSRQKVPIAKSSGTLPKPYRLRFSPEERAVLNKKLIRAQQKAVKTDEKLEQARGKLPERKKLKAERVFGEKKNKQGHKIRFESETKSQKSHLKGALPLRPIKAGANLSMGYAHNKLFQIEQENTATEAAHKGELLAEGGLRTAYRFYKTAPYRRVAKLERLSVKNNARLAYQKLLHENPQLRSNLLSRFIQKQKIKRQYAKAARESRKATQLMRQAGATGGKLFKLATGFVRSHPMVIGIATLLLLVVFSFSALFTSCTNMAMGGFSSVLVSSYTAEDEDIDDAELIYTEWENSLQMQIQKAETNYPGYDEYRYKVDDISHNPFELLAYLSAKYQDFTFSAVKAELQQIFNKQYQLSFVAETEIRYRTESHTDPETGESYDVQVPYEWHILNINLTSKSFTEVVAPGLSADEQEMYSLYMQTKGNRQYIASPFDFDWIPYITTYYGWRIHPVTGNKDYNKGIDISVPVGTDILAGQNGKIVQAAYDTGSYGYYIAIEGKDGLVCKYAYCDRLLASVGQEVKKGDVIAKSGSTGSSTGPQLHLEVMKNGRYLNPLFFVESPGTGSSAEPNIPDYSGEPMGDGSFAALLAEARNHLGKPYVFGASGPDTFDCSGFVCYVLNHSGAASVGRITAQGLYNLCTPVASRNVKPGDLIFFTGTYSTTSACSHVGIYIGNGYMIHAGNPVQYASINTSYWQEHFYAFGRLP